MKEVVIISYVDPVNVRGLQTVAINYAKLLREIGLKVSIFSKGNDVNTFYVDGIRINTYKFKKEMNLISEFSSCKKAWKYHYSKANISVINGHDYIGYLFVDSFLESDIKRIFTVHDPLLYHQQMIGKISKNTKNFKYYIAKYIERKVDKVSDITYVISRYSNERMVVKKEINNVDRKLVYDWIDTEKFYISSKSKETIRNHLNLNKDDYIIFTLRGLEKRMGIDKLIEGFDLFNQQHRNVKLLIGGRGPEEGNLKALANKIGNKNIIFLGYVPNNLINKYYQSADVFVMPSLDGEGFGLPLLEAMSCGTAVLGSNRCAIPEVLFGKTELLIDEVNAQGINIALQNLYQNRKSYSEQDFREYVLTNFSKLNVKQIFEKDFGREFT